MFSSQRDDFNVLVQLHRQAAILSSQSHLQEANSLKSYLAEKFLHYIYQHTSHIANYQLLLRDICMRVTHLMHLYYHLRLMPHAYALFDYHCQWLFTTANSMHIIHSQRQLENFRLFNHQAEKECLPTSLLEEEKEEVAPPPGFESRIQAKKIVAKI